MSGRREAALGEAVLALARWHGADEALAARLWSRLRAGFEPAAGASTITPDGVPFEVSVSLGARRGALRYLTQVGRGTDAPARLADSRRRLPAFCRLMGLPEVPFLSLVDTLVPDPVESFPPLRFGLWLGPEMWRGGAKLKVYVNTGWRSLDDARLRVCRLLEVLGWRRARSTFLGLWDELRGLGRLSFVGLENGRGGPGRIKLYFRGAPLSRRRVEAVAGRVDPASAALLGGLWAELAGEGELGPEDALLSLALDERGASVKLDVGAAHLAVEELALPQVVEASGLDAADYRATLRLLTGATGAPPKHNVVGLATEGGRPRINAYLSPGF